ncbi:hypothetical protein ACFQ0X_17955 [Streptomyces rectiviolaceus]|uniref:Uncharacterized protein n=1 Tax=Streptomyces rectiviolaceus TaxID=332591 RepID=A0ABP6M7U9_9ACTN
MEITGHSSDFIADTAFPAAVKQFVMRQQQRWPGLFLYGEPAGAESLADWKLPDDDDDDDYSGIVTFSAGQEMEDFWEENGYALDDAGEGPFSVFYRLHPQPLRAGQVTGVQCTDPEAAAAVEGTGLLLAEYFAVSLVTPEDPATDPFSGRVLVDFLESFGSPLR